MRAAHRQEGALGVERKLDLGGQIAALIVAEKCLAAIAGPFHRPLHAPRCPQHQGKFWKQRILRAEIAPDIEGDHADAFWFHPEDSRDLALLADHTAAARMQHITIALRLVVSDSGARLHRHAGDALDRSFEAHYVGGPGKSPLGLDTIPDFRVEKYVRPRA